MKKSHKRMPILLVWIMAMGLSAQTTAIKPEYAIKKIKPDLAITHLFVDKNCMVIITIENLGPGNLPEGAYITGDPQAVSFYFELIYRKSPYSRNFTKESGFKLLSVFDPSKKLKKAGGKLLYKLPNVALRHKTVTAFIDSRNNLKEQNEDNNKVVKTFPMCISR